MKRFFNFAVATVLSLSAISVARAQTYVTPTDPGVTALGGGYGSPFSYGYGHSSTLAEGVLTGQARLLQGKGLYNKLTAEAYVIGQEGYARQLENRQAEVATYFKVKQLNASYRAATMPAALTKAKLDQWNKQDQPERLSRQEYNTDSGSLQWPAVLQAQVFDGQRVVLDDAFGRRSASEFGVNSPFYQTVNSNASQMRDMLKRYLKSEERWFSPQEYTAAQNFLNGLIQEARLAPDLDGLAAN